MVTVVVGMIEQSIVVMEDEDEDEGKGKVEDEDEDEDEVVAVMARHHKWIKKLRMPCGRSVGKSASL